MLPPKGEPRLPRRLLAATGVLGRGRIAPVCVLTSAQLALCESPAHALFPPGLSTACRSGGVFPGLRHFLSVLSDLDRQSSCDRCRNDHKAGAQPQT